MAENKRDHKYADSHSHFNGVLPADILIDDIAKKYDILIPIGYFLGVGSFKNIKKERAIREQFKSLKGNGIQLCPVEHDGTTFYCIRASDISLVDGLEKAFKERLEAPESYEKMKEAYITRNAFFNFLEIFENDPRGMDIEEYKKDVLVATAKYYKETLKLSYAEMSISIGQSDDFLSTMENETNKKEVEDAGARLGFLLAYRRESNADEKLFVQGVKDRAGNPAVAGIDIMGDESHKNASIDQEKFKYMIKEMTKWAAERDKPASIFSIRVHAGERDNDNAELNLRDTLKIMTDAAGSVKDKERLPEFRIGHAVHGWEHVKTADKDLLDFIRDAKPVFEICPASNLRLGNINDAEGLRDLLEKVLELGPVGARFVLATDGPGIMKTTMEDQFRIIEDYAEKLGLDGKAIIERIENDMKTISENKIESSKQKEQEYESMKVEDNFKKNINKPNEQEIAVESESQLGAATESSGVDSSGPSGPDCPSGPDDPGDPSGPGGPKGGGPGL